MWTFQSEQIEEGRVVKIDIRYDSRPISYARALTLWQTDPAFRDFFIGLLADSPFTAFRWETPPITDATAQRDFEFALLDCPSLERPADQAAFENHFRNTENGVATFLNLGKDATMVVPSPQATDSSYGHLAAFTRRAPESQNHELWKAVGSAMQQRLGNKPVWLSTAGMGVSWLHVRLDSRPKYYGYSPYKQFP